MTMFISKNSSNEWTEEVLIDKCEKHGFRCNIIGENMFIRTNVGGWHFKLSDTSGKIKLFHENMFYNYYTKDKFGNGYHLQEKRFKNPLDIIEYIYYHDCKNFGYMKKSKSKKYDYTFRHAPKMTFA